MRVSCAQAGVWGTDPVIGLAGDYATNPGLLVDTPHKADADGAILLDLPTAYHGDAFAFYVTPSFRLGDNRDYTSIASDYAHLTLKGEFDTERSVTTASAAATRDSSLNYDYLSNGTSGVRRDGLTGDVTWDRFLTERVDAALDLNSTRVRYGESVGESTLTDYKYTSISSTLSWNTSERNNSLDGTTESRNANLQAGFVRQWSEIWSLTATVGYSRALNRLNTVEEFLVFTPSGPAIEVVPVTEEFSQNGTVYSVVLTRKGTLLSVTAVASRQLVPSGFAYLSLQESAQLTATYTRSERWSFGADVRYLKAKDPQLQGGIVERIPKYIGVNANWRWTEHWTVTFGASHITELFAPPGNNVTSNEVMITLSRQFDHIKFQ
jgi:hypothetical protein